MSQPTRFDIYCQRENRWGWTATHDGTAEDAAFTEAEALDADPEVGGVRIMAVTEYGDRAPLETLAWISPHLSKVTPPGQMRRNRARQASEPETPPESDPAETANPVFTTETFSAPAAGIETPPTPPTSPVFPTSSSPGKPPTPAAPDPFRKLVRIAAIAAIGVVVAAFGAQVIRLVLAILSRLGFGLSSSAAGFLTIMLAGSFFIVAVVTLRRRWPTSWAVARGDSDSPEPQPRTAPPTPTVDTGPAAAPPMAPPMALSVTPSQGNDLDRRLLLFLADMLSALKDAVPRLDDAVTLGLQLLIAGAAEQLGNQENVGNMDKLALLRGGLEALGARPERIDSFCREYADYRRDDLYKEMVAAGAGALRVHAVGEGNAFNGLDEALKAWVDTVTARDRAGGKVIVMVVDISLGTADITETSDAPAPLPAELKAMLESNVAGNEGRMAASAGDRLVAAFASAPDAIRAASGLQRELINYSAEAGAIRADMKIGMDSGSFADDRADSTDGDTPLAQIMANATRSCDEAYAGAIFVTDRVYDLCPGRNIPFAKIGEHAIGDDETMTTLYRVDWQSGSSLATAG